MGVSGFSGLEAQGFWAPLMRDSGFRGLGVLGFRVLGV